MLRSVRALCGAAALFAVACGGSSGSDDAAPDDDAGQELDAGPSTGLEAPGTLPRPPVGDRVPDELRPPR